MENLDRNRLENKKLTTNSLKLIAIIAMLIDHITADYIPTVSVAGQLLHIIGRLTAPIMSFFIVEGFYHTHNCKKYALRLFIFSIISYFAYQFHIYGEFFYGFRTQSVFKIATNSVIFPLFLGLLTLVIWYKTNWKEYIKVIAVCVCCLLAMTSDWALIVVLWVFYMGQYYGDFKKQMISLAVIGILFNGLMILYQFFDGQKYWWASFYQFGLVFVIPLLKQYNGKLGKSKKLKWIFYIFYPLHLFILGYLKFYVFHK